MSEFFGSSWRTTIAGAVAIFAGVYLFVEAKGQDATVSAAALIAVGIGLIKAQDA